MMPGIEHESGQETGQEAGESQGNKLAGELQDIAEQRESGPEAEIATVKATLQQNLEAALADPNGVSFKREGDRLASYLAGDLPRVDAARPEGEGGLGDRLVTGIDAAVDYIASLRDNPNQPPLNLIDYHYSGMGQGSEETGLIHPGDADIVRAAIEGPSSDAVRIKPNEWITKTPPDSMYIVREVASTAMANDGARHQVMTLVPKQSPEAAQLLTSVAERRGEAA